MSKPSKYVVLKDGDAYRVCYRAYGLPPKGMISATMSYRKAIAFKRRMEA